MDKGTYALLVHVPYGFALKVGEIGVVDFKEGYYAYIGSALGGLGGRVHRHLREKKRIRWHIDHLLLHARAVDVVVARGKRRRECDVAAGLGRVLSCVSGFGSSDCECRSHLFYDPDFDDLRRRVLTAFRECGMKPVKLEGASRL